MKLKRLFLVAVLSASYSFAHAQLLGPTPFGNLYTDHGIKTLNSWMARTSIGACWGGNPNLWGMGYLGFNFAYDGTMSQPWTYIGDGSSNGGAIIFTNDGGAINFVTKGTSPGAASGSMSNLDIQRLTRMRIGTNGKISIGSGFFTENISTDGDYLLFVEKGIMTEQVRVAVKNSNDWRDFVFQPGYRLMPLNELKDYITLNNHLPEVPSAQEVVKNGIDLQQMDATLLQKVEELTLYILEQQKQIEALKAEINIMKQE